jgi:CubicO group peptidase (beta-lactamase class C family)
MTCLRAARLSALALACSLAVSPSLAAQGRRDGYDYYSATRALVRRGTQALILCNGLFVSERSLDDVFAQELTFGGIPLLHPRDGGVTIDRERRTVVVGATGNDPIPAMRAVYREGLGAVILSPSQTFLDIDALPELTLPPLEGDPATIPWPDGDLVSDAPHTSEFDGDALLGAVAWAFDPAAQPEPERTTVSVLVVHGGRIVHERYAPGFDMTTRTRIYSVSKSIGVTLIGMLVDRGQLELDAPLGLEWLPRARDAEQDPRQAITLADLLHMSSGLQSVDNAGRADVTGSGLSYWGGASSVKGALSRALVREPGTHWDYENYDTLLAVHAMKKALGGGQKYLEFPRRELFDKIGMRNTIVGADRMGDFMLSSQIYTNARDLARFGLLYLRGGEWNGEQLISREWIDFVRTPARSTEATGRFYGGQWWFEREGEGGTIPDAFSARGNRGNYITVVPSLDLVVVRRGLDRSAAGDRGFDMSEFVRRVAKAFGA